MTMPFDGVGLASLEEARQGFASCLEKVRHCLAQLEDAQVWWRPREGMNSIGNLLLHLAGNVGQRIGSVVGGLPDSRNRDQEFAERGPIPKAELLRRLEEAFAIADAELAGLAPPSLLETRRYRVLDREREDSVLAVILRTLLHVGGHTQEIVHLTRLQVGDAYRFLLQAPPPGQGLPSEEVSAAVDAAFEQGPLPEPGPAGGLPPTPHPHAGGAAPPEPAEKPRPSVAPIGDYLRDIQEEYEEELDKGELL
jgi:hypothetical protein